MAWVDVNHSRQRLLWLLDLHHFNVYIYSRREVNVGKGFDDFRRWIQNVYHSLVNAHLKLLAGVFINKCRAVNRVFLNIYRERHGPDDFSIIASCRVYYLFDRRIQNAVLVGAHSDAEAM